MSAEILYRHLDPEELPGTVRRIVRKLCPTWLAGQHDDLVQNACLRIVRTWRRTEESKPLAASYLWKVVHSVVMDEIRRRERRPEAELKPGIHDLACEPPGSRGPAHLRDAIQRGLRTLTEPRRWAVLLHLYGFSLRESAKILGWTPKRLDNQRYRGLEQLREYLRDQGLEP